MAGFSVVTTCVLINLNVLSLNTNFKVGVDRVSDFQVGIEYSQPLDS